MIGILSLCVLCGLPALADVYNYTNSICGLSATDPYAREPYSYTDANGNTIENDNNGEITIQAFDFGDLSLTSLVIPLTRLGTVNNTPPALPNDCSYEIDYYIYNNGYN